MFLIKTYNIELVSKYYITINLYGTCFRKLIIEIIIGEVYASGKTYKKWERNIENAIG